MNINATNTMMMMMIMTSSNSNSNQMSVFVNIERKCFIRYRMFFSVFVCVRVPSKMYVSFIVVVAE